MEKLIIHSENNDENLQLKILQTLLALVNTMSIQSKELGQVTLFSKNK